jgi:TolB protein
MIIINLGILAWVGSTVYGKISYSESQVTSQSLLLSPTSIQSSPSPTQTPSPTLVSPEIPTPQEISQNTLNRKQELIILAMSDGLRIHLFAYIPIFLPLTRLMNTPWDDIHPAVSPDGTKIAFSSRRNGFWDVFILDLITQTIKRITDTPEYDGSPSWSPDGQWLVYESYQNDNLDIFLQSVADPSQPRVQLTNQPGADYAPSWSPNGREIAFTSDENGVDRINIAYLDRTTDRVIRANPFPAEKESYPRWSPDGKRLCWIEEKSTGALLMVSDTTIPDLPPRQVTYANRGAWMGDSNSIFIQVNEPNRSTFGAIMLDPGSLSMPLSPVSGTIHGFDIARVADINLFQPFISAETQKPASPLWQPFLSVYPMVPAGRFALVPIKDLSAPYPMLLDSVDEAFLKLREKVALEAGWDALSSLENAFIPLTQSPNPSIETDWAYTGRAWSLNPLYLSAGWMVVSRENYSGQTFWRVFLKARFQDGSMGMPLRVPIWDINSRFSGDPRAYENGGMLSSTPTGYWVDLSELASRYNWERLPSLVNWKTYFPSIRFNQFVIKGSLDWVTAMTELYPVEALILPTRTQIPTRYPSRTPTNSNYSAPGPTRTPTVTLTPTLNPTWTPMPGSP